MSTNVCLVSLDKDLTFDVWWNFTAMMGAASTFGQKAATEAQWSNNFMKKGSQAEGGSFEHFKSVFLMLNKHIITYKNTES